MLVVGEREREREGGSSSLDARSIDRSIEETVRYKRLNKIERLGSISLRCS